MNFSQQDTDRFFSKVNKLPNGCWLWTDHRDECGYGKFRIGKRMFLAHRISYQLRNEVIPEGMLVCHHCDNPQCVNPAHLFLGTQKDNMEDRTRKGRDLLFSGERNGQHKLTAEQVLKIRELELPPEVIAEMFRISVTQVKRLRNFQQWKHLPQQQRFSFVESRAA
jgi:hypothetical protein